MRKWWVSCLLALSLLVATGCGVQPAGGPAAAPTAAPAATPGAETGPAVMAPTAAADPVHLVVAISGEPMTLDPHKTNDGSSAFVMWQIYDTLVDQNDQMELVPGLATAWRAVDDKTWEFQLRRGVRFHNGETLTARDVKFTLDRLRDPATKSPGAFLVGQVDEVRVVDDYTVVITTTSPFAPLLSNLAHIAGSILNEKAVQAAGEDYGRQPVGTGAFRFVGWTTGQHVDLARFDGHGGDQAKVDSVRIRAIKEDATRALELETGAVDIVFPLAAQDYQRLLDNPKVEVYRAPSLGNAYVGFNTRKPPLDRVEVRQALNHAVNTAEIIEHVLLNVGSRLPGPVPPGVWGASQDLQGYPYDPERARQLLARVGVDQGLSLTLGTFSYPMYSKTAEVVQAQLAAVGVQAEIKVYELGRFIEEVGAGNVDLFTLGWTTVTGDPDYALYPLFHSSQWGGQGNLTFYKNEKVDRLLEQGRTSMDPQQRLTAYREAEKLIVSDAPWLFVAALERVAGWQKGVAGFRPHPAGHHRLAGVTKA